MSSQKTMKMVKKSANQPDETRRFDKGRIDVTNVGDTPIGRATFEPGWKWSTSVKPIVQTDSCQVNHTMYVISGKMHVRMDDGSEQEFGPGDTGIVPPGHDAWVVGNENFVGVDFTGAKSYAKK
ncbi:MAG TPA: cupin domain-containing protein [Nitrososphaera sp.]|nr:cupin domain-containing protein [Nitrososphaera sp.]